jgi:hypothetical protein
MRIYKTQDKLLSKFFFLLACIFSFLAINVYGQDTSALTTSKTLRYSIHEHHKPLLLSKVSTSEISVLGRLIHHLENQLDLKFEPVWRKGSSTGERELLRGEVDFIIDPPQFLIEHFPEDLSTQKVFQSQGVVVKNLSSKNDLIQTPARIAYLSGIADFSEAAKNHGHDSWIAHQSIDEIYQSFSRHQIDSAVLPLRLSQHQLSGGLNLSWFIDGLYGNQPANYQWIFHPSKVELKKILEVEIAAWQSQEMNSLVKKNRFDHLLSWLNASTLACISLVTLLMLYWIWKLRRERLKIIAQTSVLAESNSQAIKANEAKSNFLATVSHEIRTPIRYLGHKNYFFKHNNQN